MVTLSSLGELTAAKEAVEELRSKYPCLYEKLLDMVYLTKAFHFKYEYMGSLLMDEAPGEYSPHFVHDCVLHLYTREIKKLKSDGNFLALQQLFSHFEHTGYAKICLLVQDMPPESLVGTSYFLLR